MKTLVRNHHEWSVCLVAAWLVVYGLAVPAKADLLDRARLSNAKIAVTGEVATYAGLINDNNVEEFLAAVARREISVLAITSAGGEVNAGMTLGEWVFRNHVDVVVEGLCMSSCANYVFTAGREKTITVGSVVAWHGNVKDDLEGTEGEVREALREALTESYSLLPEEERRGMDLESLISEAIEKTLEYFERSRARQEAFFDLIGVDEYLCRIGNEEYGAEDFFVLGVEDMARFGVHSVRAPDNYQSLDLSPFRSGGKRIEFIRLD